mgnify:CR=1 FL=1
MHQEFVVGGSGQNEEAAVLSFSNRGQRGFQNPFGGCGDGFCFQVKHPGRAEDICFSERSRSVPGQMPQLLRVCFAIK